MSEKEPIETTLLKSTFEFMVRETLQRNNLTEALEKDINAIRRLISEAPESRPKVSQEWLNQKAGELSTFNFAKQHPEIARDWLFNALREAGVIVEEP